MNDPTVESATTGKSFDELYDLGHELGTGVFSVVCAGEHKTTKEQYAIKIIQKPDFVNLGKRNFAANFFIKIGKAFKIKISQVLV